MPKPKEKHRELINMNKEDVFVDAYLEYKFNGTRAALYAFDIKGKDPSNIASRIAWEYLRKPSVQDKLRARLENSGIGQNAILNELWKIARHVDKDHALSALDRLAGFADMKLKDDQSVKKAGGVIVNFNVPAPDSPQLEQHAPIDVTPSKD